MSTVGQAKITFEADTSQVSDQVVQKLEKIVERLGSIVDKMSQDIDQKSSDAGAALGDNIADGADKAEKAVDGVDASGLGAVEEAAAKAGAALGEGVADGAAAAESAVDGIDASGLSAVEEAAAKAGAAVASDLTNGASTADAALDAIDGAGLSAVEDAAAKAGAAVSGDITTGAAAADAAIDSIDGSGLVGVEEAAARAGAALNSDVSAGAAAAEAAVDSIDGSGLVHVEEAAGRAGAAISGDLTQGAAQADAAIDAIDGSGLVGVEEAAARAGAATSEMGAQAQAAGAQAQAGAETGKQGFMGMDFSIRDVVGRLGVLGGAFAAIAGPAAILKGGFDRLMDIQKAEILFQNIGLTAEETGAQMDILSDQVTGTSVSLSDAAARSAAFAQAGVELGKPMNDAVDAFTALSSAAGDSAVDVGMVMQQISAQGKVTGGDLMQLSTAGINASAWLAEEMGISMEEVSTAVSKGEVDFETFVAAVNNGAGDLAQEMGQTLPAKLGNFKTALANLGANIIEPFLPLLTVIVEVGIEITKSLIAPIKLVSGFFTSGGVAATVLTTALKVLAGVVAAAALGWGLWAAQFVLWPAIVGAATTATGIFSGALALLRGGLLALRGALMSLWTALLTNPIGWVILAVGALVAAFAVLWKKSEAFRDFWIGLWDRLTEPVKEAIDTIKGAWDGLTSIFRGEIDDDGVGALGRLIGADKVAWIIDKVTTVKQVWGELTSVFSGAQVEGGGALAKLIGMDRAERIMEIIGSIKMAWEELKAAFSGEAFGSANLERIFGESGGQTILAVFEGIGNGARMAWEWIQKIGESLREAGQAIGTAVWETLKSVFESLVDVGKALWDALVTIGKAVWDLVQALAPVLMPVLKVIGAIIGGVLVAAFFLLIGALQIVSGIFQVLGTVISWLSENVLSPLIGVIGEVVGWLVEKLGGAVAGLVDIVTGVVSGLGTILGAIWEGLQTAWETVGQPVLDFIIGAFNFWWESLKLGFRLLQAVFEVIWTALQMAWQAVGQPVLDWIVVKFNDMWTGVQIVLDWVRSKWDAIWNWVMGVYHSVISPVVDWIVVKFNTLKGGVETALNLVKGAIQGAADKVRAFYDQYVQPMVDNVVRGFNRVKDTVMGWKDSLVGALSGAGSWLVDAGRNVVQGFIDGIQSLAGTIGSAFLDMVPGWIKGPFMKALGIASPSKVFAEYGRNIGEGLIVGVGSMEGAVQASTQGLADTAANINLPAAPAMPVAAPVPVVSGEGAALAAESSTQVVDAFASMAESMSGTATGVLDPMWAAQNAQFVGLGVTTQTQANTVIVPTWQTMGANMAATQARVIAPTLAAMNAAVMQTASLFYQQITAVITPALQYLVTTLFWVLNSGVNPVFAGIRGGLQTVVGAFTNAVAAITTQWAQVGEATARPVRFTIQSVFNDGLVGMWNSVSDLLGTKKMGAYPIRFASGGILPGYTPGRDPYTFVEPNTGMSIGLSGGEAIMRPEVTRALGTSRVDSLNSAARMGGVGAVRRTLGEFNSGGVIGSITNLVRKYFPGMTITSTLRRGDPGYHGRGMAVDFSNGTDTTPGMQAAARFFHQNYGPGLAELIHYPLRGWQNIKNGRPLNYGAATNQGHRNHVHIASTRPLGPPGMPMVPYAGGGGGEEFISPAEMIAQMIKPHTDKMKSALDKRPRSGGFIDDLPVKVHDKMLSSARTSMEKAWEKMSTFGGEVNGSLGVVERWRAMVTAALARNGFEPNLRNQNLMLAQIRSESGGNPAITQQIRDVNSGGNEAAGLLQVIPGTFAAYRDPSLPNDRRDPWANMNAALRYYKARYGMDLGRMWGRGHGYAHGGLMDEGEGWFQKTAIKPERVLSPQQTASFDQLVGWLDKQPRLPEIQYKKATPGGDDGAGRVTKQVFVTQHITGGDAKKTADEIDRLVGHL